MRSSSKETIYFGKGEAFRTTPAPMTDADRDVIIEALKEYLKKNGNKGAKRK
jgi:hypothetical protein